MNERRKEWEGGKKEKEKEGKTFRLCSIKKRKSRLKYFSVSITENEAA